MYNIYMDLGYKTLNNLTSKDSNLQKQAADIIINSKDIKAFEILSFKADFIFDFIKEKINKTLISAVTKDNLLNLFDFMKIYSEDFKDFIIEPFLKYNTQEIINKLYEVIQNGNNEEKAYILEILNKLNDLNIVKYAKENINSDFHPLKCISIKILAKNNEKEELKKALQILNSDKDEFEKLQAVEFISMYGDKAYFNNVYNYLKKTGADYITASNLLLLKNFNELISEGLEDEALTIYSSLLYNFPENISFEDIDYYNDEGFFDFLIETDNNFALLLILYLKKKLEETLTDEAYSFDFSGKIRQKAEILLQNLNLISQSFLKSEIIKTSLKSDIKTEVLTAFALSNKDNTEDIINILYNTLDNEILMTALEKLKEFDCLNQVNINKIKEKINNETLEFEIKRLYS